MDKEPQLLRAMRRSDPSAWAAMYDRHVGNVFGFVFHLLGGDRSAAEDINQEVWLLAIDQFDRFDPGRGEFRNWLLGIARHRALRYRRQALGDIPENSVDRTADGSSPLDLLAEVERAGVVRAALASLPEDHRRVLVDKYVSGLSVAEIAERSGRSAKAIESLLSRARAGFRDLLQPYIFEQTEAKRHESTKS
jgi:RNA polymerase sigma-70 factor, ECF subfamily